MAFPDENRALQLRELVHLEELCAQLEQDLAREKARAGLDPHTTVPRPADPLCPKAEQILREAEHPGSSAAFQAGSNTPSAEHPSLSGEEQSLFFGRFSF